MPLVRYFFFVGGVLLALLFVSDAYAPKSPVVSSTDSGIDLPVIRIHSDRKWPERVVFDTSIPAIALAPAAKMATSVPTPVTVADVSAKAPVRDAFAQIPSSDPKPAQLSDEKKPEPKLQRKRKIAKSRVTAPIVLVAQQPQFGFFANNTW